MSDTTTTNTTTTNTNTSNTNTQQSNQKDRTVSFNQYLDKECVIILSSYRSITGIIRGWDSLNLVVENATENRSFGTEGNTQHEVKRTFPQVLIRLQTIQSILPTDGYVAIEAPFQQTGEATAAQ